MYVQLKTAHDTDQGPARIARVRFSKSWQTAYVHGRILRRRSGLADANFSDVDTDEEFWISGPKRDRTDARYGNNRVHIDDDAKDAYQAFLAGAPLPGRTSG